MALLVALFRRTLTLTTLSDAVLQSVRTTAMAFLILIGAHVLTPFFALTHIPDALANLLLSFNLGPTGVSLFILLAYIVLGTFMDKGVKLSSAGSVITPAKAGVHTYENGCLPEFILT